MFTFDTLEIDPSVPVTVDAAHTVAGKRLVRILKSITMTPSGCWECWLTPNNHRPRIDDVYAYRIVYAAVNGRIPDGLYVLHACDNGRCVRPAHLFAGTHADNMADMEAKGRANRVGWPRGERHHFATLTDAQTAAIILEVRTSSQHKVAAKFGCSQSTVWRIVHGKTREAAHV